MKILVTGAAGFIGSNTVEILERHGNRVLAVDNLSTGRPENLKQFRGKFALTDITNKESLEKDFDDFRPDAVLHLAAQSAISTAIGNPETDLTINAIGTLNVLKMAELYGVKRFVFASTSAVYLEKSTLFNIGMTENWPTTPGNPYGISKLACEGYVRTMFPNHMILRYANVYGKRQVAIGENQVIAKAFAHFLTGDDFKVVGSGNQKRDFIHVSDVAACNFDAVISDIVGTFNVATGKSYSVNQILREIEKVYGLPSYGWEHTRHEDPRGSIYLSNVKIRREFGWWPMCSLAEGILRTYQWWESGKGSKYRIMGTP